MHHFYKPVGLLLGALMVLSACEDSADSDPASRWGAAGTEWSAQQIRVLEQGRRLYLQKCAACHLASGEGQATLGAPSLRGSAIVAGPVAGHIRMVLEGRAGRNMPAFAQLLDDAQAAAVISYERNAWGNHSGELVTADAVRAQRVN